MIDLREYTAMKYAGDCKCGKCQLVPRCVLDERIVAFDVMTAALTEAERFMAYFSGETEGHFVGDGMPKECLAQIRDALGRVGAAPAPGASSQAAESAGSRTGGSE